MKAKRIIIALTTGLLLLGIGVGGTMAWLTDTAKAENTFTIGSVTGKVVEPSWSETAAQNLYVGGSVQKDPIVVNTGKNPCYVRVKVVFSNNEAKNNATLLNLDSSNWVLRGEYYYYTKAIEPMPDGTNINSSDTFKNSANSYKTLNFATTPLFKAVEIGTGYIEPNIGENKAFNVDVYAEMIQSQGFEAKGSTTQVDAIYNAFANYK